LAKALAVRVFPVPGGPSKKIARGGETPHFSKASGFLICKASLLARFTACSCPPMSSKETDGSSSITTALLTRSSSSPLKISNRPSVFVEEMGVSVGWMITFIGGGSNPSAL